MGHATEKGELRPTERLAAVSCGRATSNAAVLGVQERKEGDAGKPPTPPPPRPVPLNLVTGVRQVQVYFPVRLQAFSGLQSRPSGLPSPSSARVSRVSKSGPVKNATLPPSGSAIVRRHWEPSVVTESRPTLRGAPSSQALIDRNSETFGHPSKSLPGVTGFCEPFDEVPGFGGRDSAMHDAPLRFGGSRNP